MCITVEQSIVSFGSIVVAIPEVGGLYHCNQSRISVWDKPASSYLETETKANEKSSPLRRDVGIHSFDLSPVVVPVMLHDGSIMMLDVQVVGLLNNIDKLNLLQNQSSEFLYCFSY